MGGSCSTHGRNAYKILVGKPEEIFILVSEMSPQVTVGQPPIRWVTGALSLGVNRPWRETDHSPPPRAEVKECVELYFQSPIRLHDVVHSEA